MSDAVGAERAVFGFPGVGGYRRQDGSIRYVEITQQPTTVGRAGGRDEKAHRLLKSAGFRIALSDDIETWLKAHMVFITALESAIAAAGGDSRLLSRDAGRVREMVLAIREGFASLEHIGARVAPASLRTIFMSLPVSIASFYWRGQLRGDLGTVAIAPRVRVTLHTELRALQRDVRTMLASGPATPRLDRLIGGR